MAKRAWIRPVLTVVFALIAIALGFRIVAHEFTVDSCFDAGGVYIEAMQKCSQSQDEIDRYRSGEAGAK